MIVYEQVAHYQGIINLQRFLLLVGYGVGAARFACRKQ
jgi:hypothetical protein